MKTIITSLLILACVATKAQCPEYLTTVDSIRPVVTAAKEYLGVKLREIVSPSGRSVVYTDSAMLCEIRFRLTNATGPDDTTITGRQIVTISMVGPSDKIQKLFTEYFVPKYAACPGYILKPTYIMLDHRLLTVLSDGWKNNTQVKRLTLSAR